MSLICNQQIYAFFFLTNHELRTQDSSKNVHGAVLIFCCVIKKAGGRQYVSDTVVTTATCPLVSSYSSALCSQ